MERQMNGVLLADELKFLRRCQTDLTHDLYRLTPEDELDGRGELQQTFKTSLILQNMCRAYLQVSRASHERLTALADLMNPDGKKA